jgi:hypothetical protein
VGAYSRPRAVSGWWRAPSASAPSPAVRGTSEASAHDRAVGRRGSAPGRGPWPSHGHGRARPRKPRERAGLTSIALRDVCGSQERLRCLQRAPRCRAPAPASALPAHGGEGRGAPCVAVGPVLPGGWPARLASSSAAGGHSQRGGAHSRDLWPSLSARLSVEPPDTPQRLRQLRDGPLTAPPATMHWG